MHSLFLIIAAAFVIYILYNWFDHFRSGRFKNIHAETPIRPRLKNGMQPTITDVNLDLSEKILDHDFDSSDHS